ncbi:NAD-dependent succinate-semialdehyde dehydrogenase [Dyadobacter chenwenxiniae]|uniref:NAD-dependent succinate-semialdehyde dehydrogenase n=1 Tax=Dyadobacter chenwenxiniae TaxID=2906456 RepID=A0A9X1PRE7_9BACT|nr:NAD-dependent succinate-semialdehyde dehydrogenase [Dyadobacter chenwenxiniae]MCF0065633.1 NAD-dependent succinate-semialdehyde dehydrogenase [Dyadobacter chenwenxiniae]UON85544.1 NAD-dependent succinate-semialdehyde dehydrogenase [Dyadobacter chenwenxiniae]
MSIISINPTNGSQIKTYTDLGFEETVQKIERANTAWESWKKSTRETRNALLISMAGVLRKRSQELAVLMATEMGKPVTQGLDEVEKCARCCEYYAENAEKHLSDRIIETEASKSYVTFQPIGVVLAVMPWNFPFWQVFRFLVPALAAGNCGVLKHASNVPGCALAIEEIVRQAGFPDDVFLTLLVGSDKVSKIIEHPLIKAVTLTGSTNAGIQVATKAGSVLKKTVLELGGSDAYVVLADADLELAAESCVNSRLINGGQSCIAGKRFIIEKTVIEEFIKLFFQKMKAKRVGDPLDAATEVGPQARADLRDELHGQVEKSIEKGAVCILGGEVPPGNNAFYPPTMLINVKPGMPAYYEELFGPVASIIEAEDEADAIRIANDSIFGLGSAVFTQDIAKGEHIAATELQAGSSYVNHRVASDPRLPFGGIKTSGYGRELSDFGIHEFVNVKTVYIK